MDDAVSTIKELQEYILRTGKEFGFDKLDASQRCIMLGEEMGELFKSVRKAEGIKIDNGSEVQPVADELSDVLKQVCAIANYYDIDLEKAFRDKEQKNEGRWK